MDIAEMEKRYRGRWNENKLSGYYCELIRGTRKL